MIEATAATIAVAEAVAIATVTATITDAVAAWAVAIAAHITWFTTAPATFTTSIKMWFAPSSFSRERCAAKLHWGLSQRSWQLSVELLGPISFSLYKRIYSHLLIKLICKHQFIMPTTPRHNFAKSWSPTNIQIMCASACGLSHEGWAFGRAGGWWARPSSVKFIESFKWRQIKL